MITYLYCSYVVGWFIAAKNISEMALETFTNQEIQKAKELSVIAGLIIGLLWPFAMAYLFIYNLIGTTKRRR